VRCACAEVFFDNFFGSRLSDDFRLGQLILAQENNNDDDE